jgi:hypothetical protein
MKSKMSFFEKTFWKSSFFLLKTQHTLFEIYSPLIVMYFENRNWPVVRLKWLFSFLFFMVLCIHFRLWFGYIFWWCVMRWPFMDFKKQDVQFNTWGFIKKDCFFFLAPILSTCIIISSLIHEVPTLMEKLFKFWERHLSVQIVCLIKKSF